MRIRYSFTFAGDDNQSDDGEVLRRQCRQIRAGVERRVVAMWCKSCRQEVPGVVDPLDGRYGCPRCGAILLTDVGLDLSEVALPPKSTLADLVAAAEAAPSIAEMEAKAAATAASQRPDFEPVRAPRTEPSRVTTLRWDAANWELNEKLRHVERVTTSTRRRIDPHSAATPIAPPAASAASAAWQSHSAHGAVPAAPTFVPTAQALPYSAPPYPAPPFAHAYHPNAYAAPTHSPATFTPAPASASTHAADDAYEYEYVEVAEPQAGQVARVFASLISWLFLGGAATAFSCGGFLAGWGAVAERADLQQLGMPIVMLGIVSLVIGVLPQLFLQRQAERRSLQESHPAAHRRGPTAPHYAAATRTAPRATGYRSH